MTSRIGRPPKPERTCQWCFRIPESLASRWDLVLTDPVTSRINPNVRQEIFLPLLVRLWQAALDGSTTLDVTDLVASVRTRMGGPLE
jgi:hypothetical protein